MRAKRNKTLTLTEEELKYYQNKTAIIGDNMEESQVINKTFVGDTLEVLEKLPNKFVDLLIVDPPYNLNKAFSGSTFKKMSHQDYYEYTEKWLQKVLGKLKPTATIYVCCDWHSSIAIAPVLEKYFVVRNRITWQREKGRGAKYNWKNCSEDIWYCTMGEEFYFNVEAVKMRRKVIAPYKSDGKPKDWEDTKDGKFRNTYPANFWDDISVPYWSMAENTDHPTQKPEKLIAKLILASTKDGDVVLDPFLGSGTTSVTAKKLGRKYVGIEINSEYASWAEKRLEDAAVNKEIQGYKDGVFLARNNGNG